MRFYIAGQGGSEAEDRKHRKPPKSHDIREQDGGTSSPSSQYRRGRDGRRTLAQPDIPLPHFHDTRSLAMAAPEDRPEESARYPLHSERELARGELSYRERMPGASPLKELVPEVYPGHESYSSLYNGMGIHQNGYAYHHIEADENSRIAASKMISILMKQETLGSLDVQRDSVYGAVIALPQIARSSGWPATLTCMVIRQYFMLFFNLGLQMFLLSMIGKEQLIMYPYAGQMHLCDFASQWQNCPDGPNCRGPMGTGYTPARIYDFNIWSTRVFVRQALGALFPDIDKEALDVAADPGEYGLESWWCRAGCIFIFLMAVCDDLFDTLNLINLFYTLPSESESWIMWEGFDEQKREEIEDAKLGCVELVRLRIAGVPLHWKFVNFLCVLCPKVFLWFALVTSGVHYLMETAGITDVIVNAMAMTFVLQIDETIFSQFSTSASRELMARLESYALFDTNLEDNETDDEALSRYAQDEMSSAACWSKLLTAIPRRLVYILTLQVLFTAIYYYKKGCN
eukprot:TRINITY_DN19680_c0_g2_i3.p1 TRINITY_DN19680_c0_g2~~TRINITY_DN19680_c0_g2_i3.p1  ORF type:complete len:515 (+),score=75.15 TRINITY_DN19680_c0_g2_i3:64-1608(+)